MHRRSKSAFTIIELLVVVSIIALLIGILLPAIGKARDQARMTISQSNLRNLGTAHGNYEAEWGDQQFTLVRHDLASYGDNVADAHAEYNSTLGDTPSLIDGHPGIVLGWRYDPEDGSYGLWGYWMNEAGLSEEGLNSGLLCPIYFWSGADQGMGWFRMPNAKQFNQYVSGKYYDPVFYAPKDTVVIPLIESCLEDPGEFCVAGGRENTYWSSYCMSPAALYSPDVLRNEERGGFQDPFSLAGGLRTPSASQALHPSLKTRMIEHHWLQQRRAECNPFFGDQGTYDGCEPYYFNGGLESQPVALWYDGHVEPVGVAEAEKADARVRTQTSEGEGAVGYGLWSQDTPLGSYFSAAAYDWAQTSFHILTTDGIRGRDITGGG
mgnify:CR=1 FL=1